MEEEDGATASAQDILTASKLVQGVSTCQLSLPRRQRLRRRRPGRLAGETGVRVDTLTMLMDGADAPEERRSAVLHATYLAPMEREHHDA